MKEQKPCIVLPNELIRPHFFKFLVEIGAFKDFHEEEEIMEKFDRRDEMLTFFLELLIEAIYPVVNKDLETLYPILKVRPYKYDVTDGIKKLAIEVGSNPFFRPGILYGGKIVRFSYEAYLLQIEEDGNAWKEAYLRELKRNDQLESELIALGRKLDKLEEQGQEELLHRVVMLEAKNESLFKDLKDYQEQLNYAGVWNDHRDTIRK